MVTEFSFRLLTTLPQVLIFVLYLKMSHMQRLTDIRYFYFGDVKMWVSVCLRVKGLWYFFFLTEKNSVIQTSGTG